MKKNILMLALAVVATLVASCSGGTSSSNQSQPAQAPQGPVSYTQIQSLFTPTPSVSTTAANLKSASSGRGCGAVMNDAGVAATVATGFVVFIPVVGPVLGAIFGVGGGVLSFAGGNAASACTVYGLTAQIQNLDQEFSALESQLELQQGEINNISANAIFSDNLLWTQIAVNSEGLAAVNYTAFNTQIQNISIPYNGAFSQIMSAAGLATGSTNPMIT